MMMEPIQNGFLGKYVNKSTHNEYYATDLGNGQVELEHIDVNIKFRLEKNVFKKDFRPFQRG